MSKNVIFDVAPESMITAVTQIKEEHPDSLVVIAPFAGKISTHAPTKSGKYKGYHRIKCEILIPEDAIQGEGALLDFGAFAVMRLPKARVKDHLKS